METTESPPLSFFPPLLCMYINTEYAPMSVSVSVSLYGCLNLLLCLYVQVHHGSECTCAQGGPWLQTIGFYSPGDHPSFSVGMCTYIHFISEREHGQNLPIVVM